MTQAVTNNTLAQQITLELTSSSASLESRSTRTTYLLDRVIFFSLLVLIVVTAIPYGTVETWWDAVFECGVFALGVLWVIESFVSRTWLTSNHRLLIPLLGLLVFSFAQTLVLWDGSAIGMKTNAWLAISADPYESRLATLKLFALTLAFGLLLRYTSSARRLRILIHVVLGVVVASAVFGLVREAMQREAPYFILPYLTPGSGYGQFINRNHFAFLMEMGLGLALALVVAGTVRRGRFFVYSATVLCVWSALVLTNSRGGVFSMLSQVIFFPLLWSTTRRERKRPEQRSGESGWVSRTSKILMHTALITCLVVAVFVGVLWVGGDPLVSQMDAIPKDFTAESTNQRSNTNRTYIWRATWQLIKANPVAGVGFGGYWIAIPQYHDASGEFSPQEAHNDYLELLASGGLIGAALGAWFIVAVIKQSVGRLRSGDSFRRAACLGALVGLFGVGVHSLVDFGLHITANALIFTALVVIATADDQINNIGRSHSNVRRRQLSIVSPSKS